MPRLFYAYLSAPGLEGQAEVATGHGRQEMVVEFEDRCFFEFKGKLEPEGRALETLKAQGYHERYRGRLREIYLVGVEFSRT